MVINNMEWRWQGDYDTDYGGWISVYMNDYLTKEIEFDYLGKKIDENIYPNDLTKL